MWAALTRTHLSSVTCNPDLTITSLLALIFRFEQTPSPHLTLPSPCRGSVIAKIIGNNVRKNPSRWVERVDMYVYEEMVDGQKLTEIINTKHENVKYLPGHTLPDNVVRIT